MKGAEGIRGEKNRRESWRETDRKRKCKVKKKATETGKGNLEVIKN